MVPAKRSRAPLSTSVEQSTLLQDLKISSPKLLKEGMCIEEKRVSAVCVLRIRSDYKEQMTKHSIRPPSLPPFLSCHTALQ